MRLHFVSADYPARVAKRLKRSLESTVSPFSLQRCRTLVAGMFGYRDWHELTKAVAFAPPSSWDVDAGSEAADLRRAQYVGVLEQAGLAHAEATGIIDDIGPTRRRTEEVGGEIDFILGSDLARNTLNLSELAAGLGDLSGKPGWTRYREALKQAIRSKARWSARTVAHIENDALIVAFLDAMRTSGSEAIWDAGSLLVVGHVAGLQAPTKASGRVVAYAIQDVLPFGDPERLEDCLAAFDRKELAVLVGIGVQALGPLLVASAASVGKLGLVAADARDFAAGIVHDWKAWTPPPVFNLSRWSGSWQLEKAEDIEALRARDTEVKSILDRSDEDFLSLVSYFRRLPSGGPYADLMEAFEPIRTATDVRELLLLRMPEADVVRSVGFAIVRRTFDPSGTLQIVVEAFGVHHRYRELPVEQTLASLVGCQVQAEVGSGFAECYDRTQLDVWVESGSCDDSLIELLHQSIDNCVDFIEVAEPFGPLGLSIEARRGTPEAPRPVPHLRHFTNTDVENCDKLVEAMQTFADEVWQSAGKRRNWSAKLAYNKGTAIVFSGQKNLFLELGNDTDLRKNTSEQDAKPLALFGPEIFWVLRAIGERSGFNDDFVVVVLGRDLVAVFRGAGWRNRSWDRVGGSPVLLTPIEYGETGLEMMRRRFWNTFPLQLKHTKQREDRTRARSKTGSARIC